MKIKISPLTYFLVLILTALGYFWEVLFYLFSVSVHELTHAFVAKKYGYAMTQFRLMPYGAGVVGDLSEVTPTEEIVIALVGPLCSIILALITVALWWLYPVTYPYTEPFAQINLSLAVTNLLPVYPLDGGRIVLGLLCKKYPRAKAYQKLRKFGFVAITLLVVSFAFGAFFAPFNPSLITLTLFLLLGTLFPLPECRYARLYEISKSRKKAVQLQIFVVDENMPVKKLTGLLCRGKCARFEIVSRGQTVGRIDESDLLKIPSELYATATVVESYRFLQKNR